MDGHQIAYLVGRVGMTLILIGIIVGIIYRSRKGK
jgi:hypothetical protein